MRPITLLLLSALSTPVSAEVLWRGDFETGTTQQWRGAPKSESVQVVTDPVREGKYALQIDGSNAARRGTRDRIELQHQPAPPGTAEGTERFFGWSVFVPKKLTDDSHAVGYFETRNSWRQLMSFEVRGEDILFSTRVPYARRWSGPGKLTPGRWHDFAVHVLWSRDPAKGFVEVWFDGEQVVPRAMTATLLDENVAFFQIGLMRETIDVPETIFIDHVIEATTLAEVMPSRPAAKPNIVFIVADDMGYGDVGFQGCRDIPTPHLDALAAAGVRCTQGYVTGPYCSPSRAGLMTGRYQQRFGHEFNPGTGQGLPTTETTIADRLRAAGYVTGLIGKWHLGDLPEMHPQRRGFDEFFGFLGGGHDYFKTGDILRGNARSEETEYLTDALGREAASFIGRRRSQPFFLFLSFNAVHTPRQADGARLAKFAGIEDSRRRIYAAMLFAMDEAIGRVRARLAEMGLEKNTLVFFLSDNGGPVTRGTSTTPNGSDNSPLRGSKRTTLEGGIRVPLVISWPARLKPGTYEQPVVQLDAYTTALAAAGIPVQPEWQLDGIDLLPFLAGQNPGVPHEALYWRFGEQMAIRVGDYKLVRSDVALPGGGAKLDTDARLYRLSDDIAEASDLAADLPDKVRELQRRWDTWNATLAAPLWIDLP